MTLMKAVLRDRITKRGHKFDVCSRRAKSTRNWSFFTPGCRATDALVFYVSLHWEHRFRRVAAPTLRRASVRADARGGRIFFSPPRRVVAKIHADFSQGSLRCARVRQPSGKKHPAAPASHSFPRHSVAVSFFHSVDAARRGGTWNEFITGDTTAEPLSRIRRF